MEAYTSIVINSNNPGTIFYTLFIYQGSESYIQPQHEWSLWFIVNTDNSTLLHHRERLNNLHKTVRCEHTFHALTYGKWVNIYSNNIQRSVLASWQKGQRVLLGTLDWNVEQYKEPGACSCAHWRRLVNELFSAKMTRRPMCNGKHPRLGVYQIVEGPVVHRVTDAIDWSKCASRRGIVEVECVYHDRKLARWQIGRAHVWTPVTP